MRMDSVWPSVDRIVDSAGPQSADRIGEEYLPSVRSWRRPAPKSASNRDRRRLWGQRPRRLGVDRRSTESAPRSAAAAAY